MIVLGTKPGQHDACYALVVDGEPRFVYEHERFNQVKHAMTSDISVLFGALAEFDVSPESIDFVANCNDPELRHERKRILGRYLSDESRRRHMEIQTDWRLPTWRCILEAAGFPKQGILDVRHHIAHVAGAFYSSPFSDAAVISVDGGGETESAVLAHCTDADGIEILRSTPLPHSLGLLYQAVTIWLGWGFGEEGKTMALATYGDPARFERQMQRIISVAEDGDYRLQGLEDWPGLTFSSEEFTQHLLEPLLGRRRGATEPLESRHRDVAAAIQRVCESVMLRSADSARALTAAPALLLTGGVALNSVANGGILKRGLFPKFSVYPHANDAGTALGAALYVHQMMTASQAKATRWRLRNPYLGPGMALDQIEDVAAQFGLSGSRVEDPASTAAEALAQGQIVGWIQGRAEIGPRALGNRSILADPSASQIKDRVNAGVKHREGWRPFAPAVLRSDLATYFHADEDLPYMTVVVDLREEWRSQLDSICHVDGTARVQTVESATNPLFHRLLLEFKRRTGLGILLNTSFNDRGEPLVQTCTQAIRLYCSSGMETLVIGEWVFSHKPDSANLDMQGPSPLDHNLGKLPKSKSLLVIAAGVDDARVREVVMRLADKQEQLTVRHISLMTGMSSWANNERGLKEREILRTSLEHECVLFLLPQSEDRFVFDMTTYHSEIAAITQRLLTDGLLVYWLGSHGDVVDARTVLRVHSACIHSWR